ncbi:helix-turn-helix domain-containing protein [Branchiibius sp. NY16-3462-2]|uniref:helix-turn-helix transcriptional regulator n=1 Tax=Branchiibius sp. NY16-3462-2 TaxID=1807500 RepID=UPI000793F77D|nr:helix-turn-helix domain-containing protein [Branchiibius sp. NY16-3462-2]KYH43669.1 hypothetical protein AZH51_02340 [Branchiibius sp. NY16-3462-2]
MTTTTKNDLMTLEEVAAWLRKSQSQLRWMRHNRTGPRSALIGGRITYRRSEVEAWLDAQFDEDDLAG